MTHLINNENSSRFCSVTYQSWVEVFDTIAGEFKTIDILKEEQLLFLINSTVVQQSLLADLDSIVDTIPDNFTIVNKGIHIYTIDIDEACVDYRELAHYVKRYPLNLDKRLVNLETAITTVIDEIEDNDEEA